LEIKNWVKSKRKFLNIKGFPMSIYAFPDILYIPYTTENLSLDSPSMDYGEAM